MRKEETDIFLAHPLTKSGVLNFVLLSLFGILSIDVLLEARGIFSFASVIFLGLVFWWRRWELAACALLFLFLYVTAPYYPSFLWRIPTAPYLVPLLMTLGVILFLPNFRESLDWIKFGKIDQITGFLIVITSLLAALALMLWALWTDYLGIGASMIEDYHYIPRWFLLLLGIPVFAVLNAFAEEAVYRGLIQSALEKRFEGNIPLVLCAQASAFAAAHFAGGFPNGFMGYAMTFIYAIMLGYLRIRSGGMLAPFLTHVSADLVIGFTLFFMAT